MNAAVGLMEAPGQLPLISQKKGRGGGGLRCLASGPAEAPAPGFLPGKCTDAAGRVMDGRSGISMGEERPRRPGSLVDVKRAFCSYENINININKYGDNKRVLPNFRSDGF